MSTSQIKYNILKNPKIKRIIVDRKTQFSISMVFLLLFIFVIVSGIYGNSLGSANASTIFVWLIWFTLLLSVLVPLFGRLWCCVCPIPVIGDWVQRGRLFTNPKSTDKKYGYKKRWPKDLQNLWLSNILFIIMAALAGLLTTNPKVTAIVLIVFIVVSTITSIVFKGRTFCRYICPIGGFIGLYSQNAPVELRVVNPDLCKLHKKKDCLLGNENGYGCPWLISPVKLKTNVNCGMCFECVRTCPYDNIAINIRDVGADLYNPKVRLDEAFRSIIMVGASIVYLLIFFGPYSFLKELAYISSFIGFVKYVILLFFILFIVFGFVFMIPSYISSLLIAEDNLDVNLVFTQYVSSIIPIGLVTWIGFSFKVMFANWKYIINVISNPFGWDWTLVSFSSNTPVINWFNNSGIFIFLFILLIFASYIQSLNILSRSFQRLFEDNKEYQLTFFVHLIFLTLYIILLLFVVVG